MTLQPIPWGKRLDDVRSQASLVWLSITHVGNHNPVPRVPTNAERMKQYRKAVEPQFGNAIFRFNTNRSSTA
jgi:hypothetical protein